MPSGDLKLYDPQSVIVTFGPHQIKGFAEDSMVEAERNENSFDEVVGVDGEVTSTRSANRSGKITVKLGQTSSSNAVLSALLAADEASPNGLSVLPIMVKDMSGNSLCFGPKARIVKPPKVSYEKKPTPREWVFAVANLTIVEGGN